MHRSFLFPAFFFLLVLAFFLSDPHACGAQISSASADFQRQVVVAWGVAGAPWEKQPSFEEERSRAWMDAMHHAYEAILSLPLMEEATVRGAMIQIPTLRERVGRLLLQSPKFFFEPDTTGLLRCRVEVPFAGRDSLRTALYLAALRPGGPEPKGFLASVSVVAKSEEPLADEATGTAPVRAVLDLRRTVFEPSLFPRFFSEDGRLLFQEAQIPSTERFSRPVVRFTSLIEEAAAGVAADGVFYVEAHVPTLARRDVQVRKADEILFHRFCRDLTENPLSQREILIVYGTTMLPAGVLPKAKDKTDAAAGAAKPKESGKKGRKNK